MEMSHLLKAQKFLCFVFNSRSPKFKFLVFIVSFNVLNITLRFKGILH